MKKYGAGEFKAKCLGILDDVAREQQAVYITKRGKLVAALVPPPSQTQDLIATLKGSVVFEKDIVSPIDEKWEVWG